MTNRQTKPDVDPKRGQEKRQRTASRNMKVGAFAVAAAIGLAVVACTSRPPDGQNASTPAGGPTVAPVDTAAVEVATGFVEAYGSLDADRAITYLADDADLSGLTTTVRTEGIGGPLKEFRLLVSWLEAEGYKQMLNSCEELSSLASETRLRCTFDFHALGSDEIGRGPYSGSYFDLTVRDGEIARASIAWGVQEFSPQMWEPFASWVSKAYPEDAAVMYEDETYSKARATEKSIRLWERHSLEYVEEVGQ